MTQHLICTSDLTEELLRKILADSHSYKNNKRLNANLLQGKVIALWFTLPSTRTRISFCSAISQLGGYPLILNPNELQLSRGESWKDSIQSLKSYVDGIIIRTSDHSALLEMKSMVDFPIINALTDLLHPCQIIADLLTMQVHHLNLEELKMTYLGDGNNVCHSLMIACAMMKIPLTISTPKQHAPSPKINQQITQILGRQQKLIKYIEDPIKAVNDANILYTDVWTSMGSAIKDESIFLPYQINKNLTKFANNNFKIMHCLPLYRDKEIASNIIDSPESLIWQQAANRLPAQKAILANLFNH